MIKIALSTDEIALLQGYTRSPIELIQCKALTMLARHQQVSFSTLTIMFHRDVRSLERWVKDFSLRRMASIFSGMVNNEHASKLTREQKEEIKQTLSQPPSDHGLSKEFWDVPTLRGYVAATFGVAYESDQSYHYLLRFSRLSFKYPDTFDIHRDEQAIAKRIQEIREDIAPLLKDPQWEVYASDETGLQLEALTKKAWLKKGEKTIIKTERSKQKQNYLGFLNLTTGKCSLYHIARGQQTYILSATKKHIAKSPGKKICIIWDNGSFHKGKLLIEALKRGQPLERVHLISLPPYAPDTNPIEHVWREGKQATANHQFKDFHDTKRAFEQKINGRKFNYTI